MPDSLSKQLPPVVLFILGIVSISAGLIFAYIGKAWVRFHGWVYRAKEPKWFWWEVALYILAGLGLFAVFLSL